MPELILRRLTPAHAEAYRRLMLDAYARHPDAFTSSVAERAALPLSWWEARLSDAPGATEWVWGALRAGALVGVAGLAFETREKSRHKALLFGMAVTPPCRGSGIGERLVRTVLEAARARPGVRLVQLTVTQGNRAAEDLYARCGFVPFGVEPLAVAVPDGEGGVTFVSKVHLWRELQDRDKPAGFVPDGTGAITP